LLASALGLLALLVAYFAWGAFETQTSYHPNPAELTLAGIDEIVESLGKSAANALPSLGAKDYFRRLIDRSK